MSTPYVEYEYADGSANTLRPTRVRYPDGRELDYSYGASGSDDDRLSRVYQLKDGATVLAQYDYLGAAGFARCELPQPQLRWNLSPSGNSFSGLDSLDRTVDCLWQKYAPSASTPVQIGYTYDRASNRTSRDVTGTTGNDERYRYDGLNRLTDLDRGDLSAAKITAPQAAEQWRLDATGNWGRYENLDFVTPGNSLDQDRTTNQANEITGFTSTVGASWPQPAYDRGGNMTTFPQPAAPASSFTATYDAWNRLVGLSGGSSYAYDALNRRTMQIAGGVTRHYYYSTSWQVLEERLGTSPDAADAERQFVWGLRYVDDLVLRDRSPTNNGTLGERLYALQDANWNVVAVTNAGGAVQERYRYSAYGTPTFLQPNFTPRSPNQSGLDWETLYAGYRFDRASGLYQVRFRYLNSTVGAWVTSDPLLYKIDDFNLYQFSRSNPLRYVDAVGLDVLDCVVACIEDNDPINLAVEAIIAQIAVGLWPKEMFAAIASALGDEKLANAIRFSANSGSRVTTMPKGLMTLLRTPNKTKLAWKALTKHVSRGVGPVLIAYGLALAAIEVNCTAYCCTAYWTGGLPYKPGDYNIATTTWNFYFGD